MSKRYPTPQEAEAAFYKAFEHKDVQEMMTVWADTSDVVCIHPMGPNLNGIDSVRDAWQILFDQGPNLSFDVHTIQYLERDDMAIHVVRENIMVNEDSENVPVIIATNVYRQTDKGWQMVLHHSSPGPGENAGHDADDDEAPTLH